MSPVELVIAALIVHWMARRLLVEGALAVRGVVPPTWERGRARAGGGRYGARAYLADAYSDAWRQARSRREARMERAAAGGGDGPRRPGRLRAALAGAWSRGWQRWQTRMDRRQADRPPSAGGDRVETPGRYQPGAGEPSRPDPDLQARRLNGDQDDATEPARPAEPVTPTRWDDPPPPVPPPARSDRELTARPVEGGRWEVIEDRDRRGDDMAEVTGLVSAHAHAAAMRQAYENSATDAEQYAAGLQAGGVTGEALAAVQQAMEAQQQAAAAWATAEATLGRHMQVRESYDANPDAGTREFVRAE